MQGLLMTSSRTSTSPKETRAELSSLSSDSFAEPLIPVFHGCTEGTRHSRSGQICIQQQSPHSNQCPPDQADYLGPNDGTHHTLVKAYASIILSSIYLFMMTAFQLLTNP